MSPEAAGLYVLEGDVRRVPGLRREEEADLAGLSVDYYTQLERGDLDGASDSVLGAVARALRLDDAERLHLFDLARAGVATRLAPSHGVISSELQRTLDAFTGMALVRNRRWDYLAANTLGRAVYEDMFDGRMDPLNQVCYVFLDERARDFYRDKLKTYGALAKVIEDPRVRHQLESVREAKAPPRHQGNTMIQSVIDNGKDRPSVKADSSTVDTVIRAQGGSAPPPPNK